MIHFDVTKLGTDNPQDRELRLEGTSIVIGWIEFGRRMTSLTIECGFTPASSGGDEYPVRDHIAACYEDAKAHVAATLSGVDS